MSEKTKPNYLITFLFPIFILKLIFLFWLIFSVESFAGSMGSDVGNIHLSDPDIINCEYKVIEAAYTPRIKNQLELAKASLETEDYHNAYLLLKPIADKGHMVAQTIIGNMHELNQGGAELSDYKAQQYYEKAACQGYAEANYHLAVIYYYGHSTIRHKGIAYNYFVKAAELGDSNGMHNAGAMTLFGDGIEVDEKQAVYWFNKAAAQRNSYSMFNLGISYFNGIGVKKDILKAYMWFDLAHFFENERALEWKELLEREHLTFSDIKEAYKMSEQCAGKGFIDCGQREI